MSASVRAPRDSLDAAELAAVVSGLTFESRNADDLPTPQFPTREVRDAASTMNDLCAELQQLEREHRVKFLRTPDFAFAGAVWSWCHDATLDQVLNDMDLAAGDFVRAMKQLIDVVAQIADAAGPGPLRKTAREALDALRHGVVSYASISA
ncbi:hypothetical protein [Aeromicrobium sp. UC242_57]|uniref:hypothetical protein n=1 Tax=Aeromicrobium sp. UC242_57 TaxID=3374624 RepID=UPI0037887F46